jgi:hypothetical protein
MKKKKGFSGDSVDTVLGGNGGLSIPGAPIASPPTIIAASFNGMIEEIDITFSEAVEIVGTAASLDITVHYENNNRLIEGAAFQVQSSVHVTGSPMTVDTPGGITGPSVSYTRNASNYIRSVATGLPVATTLQFPMNVE